MRAIERERNAGVRMFQWLVWRGIGEEPGWVTHNKTWAGCLCPVLSCPDLTCPVCPMVVLLFVERKKKDAVKA